LRKLILRVGVGVFALTLAVILWAWNSAAGQDWLLERAATAVMQRPPPVSGFDGLQVFLCGTSSPLPEAGRAQACVAVMAGESLYVVDAGAGSAQTAALGQLPLERLNAVLLTHFHSDHFAALPDFNLNSWVAGRPAPLTVIGPAGVDAVVDGLNRAYAFDRGYRVAHHGPALLPPELGSMVARPIESGAILEMGELTVTSFEVNHEPVEPAFGYRFDFRGRSVVISGDAIVTDSLTKAASGADLLLQDALSTPIIKALETASAGSRMATIFADIQDYHAHVSDLSALVEDSGLKTLALYHLVPPPSNALLRNIFLRDAPDGTVLTEDGMIIELPAHSEAVNVIAP
jgi:ribonuclease Z